MNLLKIGTNTKLGPGIAGFSLPAVTTCPGRTKLCEGICYATSGFFRFRNVRTSLQRSYEASKLDGFASVISDEIGRRRSIKAVRIHPSGDFYSSEYIAKWITIIKSNPDTKFWAYTRSWRRPDLVDKLKELSELPNIQLFASVDEEAGRPQQTTAESAGQADSEIPEVPPSWLRVADVVKDWSAMDRTYVRCPNQKNDSIKCSKCTYCFQPSRNSKVNVVFTVH